MTASSCICSHSASRYAMAVHLAVVSTKEGLISQCEHVGTFYSDRIPGADDKNKHNSKTSDFDRDSSSRMATNDDKNPLPVVTAEAVRMEECEQDLPSLDLSSSSAVGAGPAAMDCSSCSQRSERTQGQVHGNHISRTSSRRRRQTLSPIAAHHNNNNKNWEYSHSSLAETVPEAIATPVDCGPEPQHRRICEDIDGSWNRPEYISATVVRESVDVKFGVTFSFSGKRSSKKKFLSLLGGKNKKRQNKNCLPFISDLDDEGLLAEAFCVGDLLVSINKQSCQGISPSELSDLLDDLTGKITIVVRHPGGDGSLVESCLLKPSPSSKTGLGVTYSSRYNRLKVNQVHYDGLMVDSLLQVEDRIIAINHTPCQHLNPSTAVEQIAQSPLWISIVARKHQHAGVVLTVQDNESTPSSSSSSSDENDKFKTWYPATRSYDPRPRIRIFPSAHPFCRTYDSRRRQRLLPISRQERPTQRLQASDDSLLLSNREDPTIAFSASF